MTRLNAMLLGLGFLCFSSAYAAEPGWYIVGFGGESSASGLNLNRSEDNFVAIIESAGLDVVTVESTLDDSDTGFGLAGGYQLNDHFALEFAYLDLGEFSSRHSATITDGAEQADADVELATSADGFVASALGILPIGERFSVFGRAGISLMSATGSARITIEDVSQRVSQSSQKTAPLIGIGAEYNLGKFFAIRLAWDRYIDVGTEDVSGDIDADLISLGFRMGVGWFK